MYDFPILPVVYLQKLIELMEEENLPSKHLLKESGIDINAINIGTYVSISQMESALRNYLKLTNIKNPGVAYGLKLDSQTHGFLGFVYIHHNRSFLLTKSIIEYMNVRLPVLRLKIVVEQDYFAVRFCNAAIPPDLRVFIQQAYITSFYKLGSMIVPNLQVHISQPYFTSSASLQDVFRHGIFVDSEYDEIRYFTHTDSFLKAMTHTAKTHTNTIDTPSIVLKLRQYLVVHNDRLVSAENAAEQLGMSARTLSRKLAECGYNFRSIRQEVLMNTAMRYLQNSSLSIERIAETCGYSDQASFTRAFQKWQGQTPDVIRRSPKA